MNNPIRRFLDSITMYRLLLYGLGILVVIGMIVAAQRDLGFSTVQLCESALLLLAVSYGTNKLLAYAYGVPANAESSLISALILVLILPPVSNFLSVLALIVAGILAMASKYVLAFGRKHIFNPAAFAAFGISILGLIQPAWWIGSAVFLPYTLILSLLILAKIRRFTLAVSFVVVSLVILLWLGHFDGIGIHDTLRYALVSGPLIFFAGVMLTEPLTAPSNKNSRLLYGALIGLLYASRWHLGSIYQSPELALLVGNIFAFSTGRKTKPLLHLKVVKRLAPGMYELIFTPSEHLQFSPGQYAELTLSHANPDGRGNRRTFSMVSSPLEAELRFAIKVPEQTSSFKHALLQLKPGTALGVGSIGGDFRFPTDTSKKLAFLAGGIGITPFCSMAAGLIDYKEERDIIMLQALSSVEEGIYKEVFDKAKPFGLRVISVLSNKAVLPADWSGYVGRINEAILKEEIPDFKERTFYISGSPGFVDHCRAALKQLNISGPQIVTDYFTGY